MNYIDFHTHLDWYEDQELLFNQLKDFSGTIVASSVDLQSYQNNLQIRDKAKALGYKVNIIPTLGIHPQNVIKEINNLKNFDCYLNSSPLIGEIGMDFCWYKEASPKDQETVLRYFLEHCNKAKKVCVIHTKEAEQQICNILSDYQNLIPVIHWYDGPIDVYKEFVNRKYYFTFGVETCRSKSIQELLKYTPIENILAETDNPTAEPWLGGFDNSIFLIKKVYKDIEDTILSFYKHGDSINENLRNKSLYNKCLYIEDIYQIINQNSNKLLDYSIHNNLLK